MNCNKCGGIVRCMNCGDLPELPTVDELQQYIWKIEDALRIEGGTFVDGHIHWEPLVSAVETHTANGKDEAQNGRNQVQALRGDLR